MLTEVCPFCARRNPHPCPRDWISQCQFLTISRSALWTLAHLDIHLIEVSADQWQVLSAIEACSVGRDGKDSIWSSYLRFFSALLSKKLNLFHVPLISPTSHVISWGISLDASRWAYSKIKPHATPRPRLPLFRQHLVTISPRSPTAPRSASR